MKSSSLFRILKIAFSFWISKAASNFIGDLKIRCARIYLQTLDALRQSVLLIFVLILGALLSLLSFAFLIVGFMIWLPWETGTKAILLMAIGGIGLLIGILLVLGASSEKRWMEIFRADEILDRLQK